MNQRMSLTDMISSGQPISMHDFVNMHVEPQYAVGGGVTNTSDTRPDVTDAGGMIPAPFYADGGEIKLNFKGLRGRKVKKMEDGGAAFGIYPKQRAKPSAEPAKKFMRETLPEFIVPQDMLDVALIDRKSTRLNSSH